MSKAAGEEVIRSAQNNRLKQIRRLQKDAKSRRKDKLAVVEGPKVIAQLLKDPGRIELHSVFVAEDSFTELASACRSQNLAVFTVQPKLLAGVADTKTFSGILALFSLPENQAVVPRPGELVLALNGIQDPGNAGTLIRSAYAFGVKTLVLIGGNVDLFSPKVIRSTMGSFAYLNYEAWSLSDFTEKKSAFQVIAAAGSGETEIELEDKPRLLVIGNESAGVDKTILRDADNKLGIAMEPGCESLNAGVAGSILLQRFYRQKQ